MAENFNFTECEYDYMGEGYDPSMAAEMCANLESQRLEDEAEKSHEDEGWEYWLG